jgi:hypothetical protein
MSNSGPIRALLLEGDANSAVLTRDMLDEASAGLVDLVHFEELGPAAIERLASEAFDVILFRARRSGSPARSAWIGFCCRRPASRSSCLPFCLTWISSCP